jgi:hypothetical protein
MPKITVEITKANDNEKHLHYAYADGLLIGYIWDTIDRVIENKDGVCHRYHVYFTGLTCIYADEIKYVEFATTNKEAVTA